MRTRSWLKRALVAVALTALVMAALTARLFVWPATGSASSVDAVVVLSGDYGDRMQRALELMADDAAPVLVHAGEPDSLFALHLCEKTDLGFEAVCLLPKPDDTRGEARAVGELVRQRHWKSIAVVTTNFHVTRAGIEFRRCVEARVSIISTTSKAGRRFGLGQIPREWLRVLYLQVAHRGC